MIEGVTKPVGPEALFITDEQRQVAAASYIASMDALFAKFDPETGGNDTLPVDAPFEDEEDGIGVVAERRTKILIVTAPDSQIHSYSLQDNDSEVWREDGISLNSLGNPDSRINRRELSDLEALAQLKRTIAEREALKAHKPTGRFVDEEEVQKLFAALLQGRVNREGLKFSEDGE